MYDVHGQLILAAEAARGEVRGLGWVMEQGWGLGVGVSVTPS